MAFVTWSVFYWAKVAVVLVKLNLTELNYIIANFGMDAEVCHRGCRTYFAAWVTSALWVKISRRDKNNQRFLYTVEHNIFVHEIEAMKKR